MDQLTLNTIPAVVPSTALVHQVSALISEVVAEAFRINCMGARVAVSHEPGLVRFEVWAPVQSLPLSRVQRAYGVMKWIADTRHSYISFYEVLYVDESLNDPLHVVEGWLKQLSVVEHNLAAFKCREHSPLSTVDISQCGALGTVLLNDKQSG